MKTLVVQERDNRGTTRASGSSHPVDFVTTSEGPRLVPQSECRSGLCVAVTVVVCAAFLATVGCRSSKDRLPDIGSKTYISFVSTFYTGLAGLQVGDDVRADANLQRATELIPAEPASRVDRGVLA